MINPAGASTSWYIDSGNVCHGFVRAPDGTITTFDAPGAGTGAWQGTFPLTINPAGAVTGYYVDASGVAHGFVRTMKHEEDRERWVSPLHEFERRANE
jgi:hypothetical protein